MKVASRCSERNASFSSGQPAKRTGWKVPSPVLFSLMKWVTGQVRWQVTGRKPTRKRPAAGGRGSHALRLSHRCRSVTAATQPSTPSSTRFDSAIGRPPRNRPASLAEDLLLVGQDLLLVGDDLLLVGLDLLLVFQQLVEF